MDIRREESYVLPCDNTKSELWNIQNRIKVIIINTLKDVGIANIALTMFEKSTGTEKTKPSVVMRNYNLRSEGNRFMTIWFVEFQLELYGLTDDQIAFFSTKIMQDDYQPYNFTVERIDFSSQYTNEELSVAYFSVTHH